MGVCVISGGTATNAVVGGFGDAVVYVMPVSDNGGSTWEIQRVFGGVAIGDLRSRMVRLVEEDALRAFLGHRLRGEQEWRDLLGGADTIWDGVVSRPILLPYLEKVQSEIQKRGAKFNFHNASVGNLVLTGLRLSTGDLQKSIDLMGEIGKVPSSQRVVPCINTNNSETIAVQLTNGEVIIGQNSISHPSDSPLLFDKTSAPQLSSPIGSLYYIDSIRGEYQPQASPAMLDALDGSGTIVYSIGSLWTSLVPVLVLRGVAERIAKCTRRVLLVNATHDRETHGLSVVDILKVVVGSLQYSKTQVRRNVLEMPLLELQTRLKDAVDEVVYLSEGEIPLGVSLTSLPLKIQKLTGNSFNVSKLQTLF